MRSCTIFEQNSEPKNYKNCTCITKYTSKPSFHFPMGCHVKLPCTRHCAQKIKFPIFIEYHPGDRGNYAFIHDSFERDVMLYSETNITYEVLYH